MLEHILETLHNSEQQNGNWYSELYIKVPSGYGADLLSYTNSTYYRTYGFKQTKKRFSKEHVIAIAAINYPNLHELMEDIAYKIIELY